MTRKSIFISVAGILLIAFGMATLIYRNYQSSLPGSPGAGSQAVSERQGAPIKGPVDAKVTIVEFFDPACETCADFYPLVKQLMDRYPGKVRTMMRYAPLHTGSDQVVKMLEAAHLQGKFFPALELLFANQRRWVVNHVSQPDRAMAILKGMALDHDKLGRHERPGGQPGSHRGRAGRPGARCAGDPGVFRQRPAAAGVGLRATRAVGRKRGEGKLLIPEAGI